MPTPAFMRGVPITQSFGVGLGAISGTAISIPAITGEAERFITFQFTFSADPGANVYNVMISLDGTTFTLLDTASVSGAGGAGYTKTVTIRVNAALVRLDQVSKTNGVTTTVVLFAE